MKKSATWGLFPARVLVVDDEPLIRWSICVALTAAGFDADAASTADEARLLAAAGPRGGRRAGRRTARRRPQPLIDQIRAVSPESRFLVMSTARQTAETLRGFGDVQVVDKPFDLTKLVSAVSELALVGSRAKDGH